MFIRTREKIKDYFKLSKKYIKAKSVLMFIETSGKDVIFCTEIDGDYYRLYNCKVSINLDNYKPLQTIGVWGTGIAESLESFVELSDENREMIYKFQKYIQAGFKYRNNGLSYNKLEDLKNSQNKEHLMSCHKYNKKFLLKIEDYLNKLLKTNKPTIDSYRCKREEDLVL